MRKSARAVPHISPAALFPELRGGSGCGGSRLPLPCHRERDISRRCRNQQRGVDRADVYPRSVRKRRLLGFADTTPVRPQPSLRLPPLPSRLPPSGRRPVGHPQWTWSPAEKSVRISPSSPPACAYLPSSPSFIFSKIKKCSPPQSLPFFPPSPRSPLTSFFPQLTRFRVQRSRLQSPSIAF